jgi:hypothetical protein
VRRYQNFDEIVEDRRTNPDSIRYIEGVVGDEALIKLEAQHGETAAIQSA